jgi:DNA-binding response OmpR family regulator
MLAVPGERGSVLVVEDAPTSASLMAELVEAEGFTAVVCANAKEARRAFAAQKPAAILLDWVLPDTPGTELCRELRAQDAALPIIFVSGRNDETSVARGLDAGADDYVAKPVRPGELIARLEAHLRRVSAIRGSTPAGLDGPTAEKHMLFGEVEIEPASRQVRVGGKRVRLGPLEYKLLDYLARNGGVAVSREQIMNEVYGINADIGTERVDLLVRRVRLKLGLNPTKGGYIVAHPGYGYQLERRGAD